MYLVIRQNNGSQLFHGSDGRNVVDQAVSEIKRSQIGAVFEDRCIIFLIVAFIAVAVQSREDNRVGADRPSLEMNDPDKLDVRVSLAELLHLVI